MTLLKCNLFSYAPLTQDMECFLALWRLLFAWLCFCSVFFYCLKLPCMKIYKRVFLQIKHPCFTWDLGPLHPSSHQLQSPGPSLQRLGQTPPTLGPEMSQGLPVLYGPGAFQAVASALGLEWVSFCEEFFKSEVSPLSQGTPPSSSPHCHAPRFNPCWFSEPALLGTQLPS